MNNVVFSDEFHLVKKSRNFRIACLETKIQKIKTRVTRASSQKILNDILLQYETELSDLTNSPIKETPFR